MMNITFFYPSKRIGGAQLLFIRMALELSSKKGFKVNVIDYRDGFLKAQLNQNKDIQILPFENNSITLINETILVAPLSTIADLKYIVKVDYKAIKFLFWCIHPNNLSDAIYGKGRRFFINIAKVAFQIKMTSEKGQIIYMDSANYEATSSFIRSKFNPVYLPIPLHINNSTLTKRKKCSLTKELNLVWIGRISNDKVYSIVKIVDEIVTYEKSSTLKVHFHIIGEGEKLNFLIDYLQNSKITYTLTGTLMGSQLEEYLSSGIDLGVAMGTSAMELASRNIPVFLIDYSFNKFPADIHYNWLFETEGYTLGEAVEIAKNRKHTFQELISQVQNDNHLADKCLEYIKKNHDIGIICNVFNDYCLRVIQQDSKALKDLNNYLNPLLFRILCHTYYYIMRLYRRFTT